MLRDCDKLSGEIEKTIKALAEKVVIAELTVEDLTGGNFTITNGGVFGSLACHSIIQSPEIARFWNTTAIKERPVALNE